MKKLLLLGALLCTACLAAQARNRYFTHLTLDDGLSHNHIKAIVQDSYGFIWIGTKNGLNRYDGSSIRIFQCFDPATGHGDSNISSLYEDTERRLWCGTDRGIYIYTPLTERFEEFTHTTEEGTAITNWVAAIESDPSGAVWAVVPNQGLFCWRNGQLRTYPVPGPQCLCIRRNGQVWGRHLRRRTLPLQCRGGSFRRLPHRPRRPHAPRRIRLRLVRARLIAGHRRSRRTTQAARPENDDAERHRRSRSARHDAARRRELRRRTVGHHPRRGLRHRRPYGPHDPFPRGDAQSLQPFGQELQRALPRPGRGHLGRHTARRRELLRQPEFRLRQIHPL